MSAARPILVIGARGQLGTDLCARLGPAAVAVDLPEFDATCEEQVAAAFERYRPHAAINCAAQTNVDLCEREPAAAFAANALTALHIARQSERHHAKVVFISTDYVFGAGGARAAAYTENDLPGPINVYGATKLAGEQLTAAHNPRHYIVRTSGLYGRAGARGKGGNFVETMRRLAGAGRPIRVVNDQRLSPTATRELADRVLQLLETREYGVFHVAARDHCTWYEFAAAIFAELDAPVDLEPIPSSAYPQPARRPAMSALTSIRLPALQLAPCPAWRQMLTAYLEQPSDVQIAH